MREFKVTEQAAGDIYGVVLSGVEADSGATAARRQALLARRRARSEGPAGPGAAASGPGGVTGRTIGLADARRIDDNLVQAGSLIGCAHCGHQLADAAADTELALLRHEGPSTEAGPQILSGPGQYVDDEVVYRQLVCPGCLTAAYSGVVPRTHVDHVIDITRFTGAPA